MTPRGLEPESVTDCETKTSEYRQGGGGAESGALSADSAEIDHDNEPQAEPSADADRLAVIADLLADLPQAERRAVIEELTPADRAAVARMLIGRNR